MRISVAGPIIVNGSKFVSRSEDCMYSLLSFHFLVLKLIAEIGKCNGASRRLSEMVEDIGGSYGRFFCHVVLLDLAYRTTSAGS